MSNQMQAMAGSGRKVNKRLRVPVAMGAISKLFGVLWAHYPGTVFEEGETDEVLRKRMGRWFHVLASKHGFKPDLILSVSRDLDALQKHERDVLCPTLEVIIKLCEIKQVDISKPRDINAVNVQRQKIRLMMKGEQAA